MDTTLKNRIRPVADEDDVQTAATIIAEAFSPLPVSQHLVTDPRERVPILRTVFTIDITHAMNYGTVDLLTQTGGVRGIGAAAGVAVWLDRSRPVPEPPDYERRLQIATGRFYAQFVLLDLLFAEHHPPGPHHHLALLAVARGQQNTGIGAALLKHHHEHLDRHQISAYLEASGPDSARLYQRHGYERSGPDFELAPGAGFIPMWREPRRVDNR